MPATEQEIKSALSKLNLADDKLWTADDLPRVEALGLEGVTRAQITSAAPQFTRKTPNLELPIDDKLDEPDAPHGERSTAFTMESSEFGGAEPKGEDEVDGGDPESEPPPVDLSPEEIRDDIAKAQAEVEEATRAQVLATKALRAAELRADEVLRRTQVDDKDHARRNQMTIMRYLRGVSANHDPTPTPLERAMARPPGQQATRPVRMRKPTE